MKLNLYGDYWYFNGKFSPIIVRIIEFRPLKPISGLAKVAERNGKEFTTIRAYLYKNHQINIAVEQHAEDLLNWSKQNQINQFNGVLHKPANIIIKQE